MRKKVIDKDYPLKKKVFLYDGEFSVCCWCGGDYIEITQGDEFFNLSKKDFNTLYNLMT